MIITIDFYDFLLYNTIKIEISKIRNLFNAKFHISYLKPVIFFFFKKW